MAWPKLPADFPTHDMSWIGASSDYQKAFDFSKVPGVVIAHVSKDTGMFLGSPHFVILPDGAYLASLGVFGKTWAEPWASFIYKSVDKGKTWTGFSRVNCIGFASFIVNKDALYLIGTGIGSPKNFGFLVSRSLDGGKTWTEPMDEKTGIIDRQPFMTCPMPVTVANGRIYVHCEGGKQDFKAKGWAHQNSFVMSALVGSDLLAVSNWTRSNSVHIPEALAIQAHMGWLEGNPVYRESDKKVFNILRVHGVTDEIAARYEISSDGKTAKFDPNTGFFRFPGGCKKFYIQHDAQSGTYYALSNWTLEQDRGKVKNCPHPIKAERTRNTLALSRSTNLEDWEVYYVVMHGNDLEHMGFQYPSFAIDGNDIVFVLRTAFPDGKSNADNQHNSDFILFNRIKNFRNLSLRSDPLYQP